MTRPILTQIILKSTSGLPTDVYVTDLVVLDTLTHSDAALAPAIAGPVSGFFNDTRTATGTDLVSRMNPCLASTAEVRCFDLTGHLDGTPHGSPVSVADFTLDPRASADPLPQEVAIAMSFHGDTTGIPEKSGSTRPKARRRGRMFLGPWAQSGVVAGPVGGQIFVNIPLQDDLAEAATQLLSDLAASDLEWSVWSRKNAALYPVVGGWIDNAFDTIRSRGNDPDGRIFFP